MDVSYQTRCKFTDDYTRQYALMLKNWLGKVPIEQARIDLASELPAPVWRSSALSL